MVRFVGNEGAWWLHVPFEVLHELVVLCCPAFPALLSVLFGSKWFHLGASNPRNRGVEPSSLSVTGSYSRREDGREIEFLLDDNVQPVPAEAKT